jgi:serine/threonine protein kinase
VLIGEDKIARLTDFGLATVLHNPSTAGTMTGGSGVRGTVRWMAPELLQARIDEVSAQPSVYSDVYALSITLWEVRRCTLRNMISMAN